MSLRQWSSSLPRILPPQQIRDDAALAILSNWLPKRSDKQMVIDSGDYNKDPTRDHRFIQALDEKYCLEVCPMQPKSTTQWSSSLDLVMYRHSDAYVITNVQTKSHYFTDHKSVFIGLNKATSQ
ncbi:uncharacterized protein LOC144123885 [Amblyomma americanum]